MEGKFCRISKEVRDRLQRIVATSEFGPGINPATVFSSFQVKNTECYNCELLNL